MVERVFDRVKHYRRAATRHDRLDETFLANLQLILIAIYLKKHIDARRHRFERTSGVGGCRRDRKGPCVSSEVMRRFAR